MKTSYKVPFFLLRIRGGYYAVECGIQY